MNCLICGMTIHYQQIPKFDKDRYPLYMNWKYNILEKDICWSCWYNKQKGVDL